MVLPFVPVMPTTGSRAVGSPRQRAAATAIAARTSSTTTSGTPSSSGRSTTSAAAPRATASGAKSWPSRVKPGTQKNSVPGCTARLSKARSRISTSGPAPSSSRRVIRAQSTNGCGRYAARARSTIAGPSTPAGSVPNKRPRARRAGRRRTRRPRPAVRAAPAATPGRRARGPRPRAARATARPGRRAPPASRAARRGARRAARRAPRAQLALGQERRQALGLARQRAQDVEAHHVAGALPDAVQRRVAQQPRHRRLLDVAVAAQALERLGGVRRRALADPVLEHRRGEAAQRRVAPRRRRAPAAARSRWRPRTRARGRRAR